MLIENDLLNISDAIKMIDQQYFLQFNEFKNRFEVHNKRDNPTLCLIVPFSELDFRTVRLLYDSHISRRKEYFENLEKENAKLQKNAEEKNNNNLMSKIENFF